jgi:hypothetical protein
MTIPPNTRLRDLTNTPTRKTTMTTQFQVGKTYSTRSICDYECILSFTILARTDKYVTVDVNCKTVRRGISIYEGVEKFKPYGTYSMCAVVSADSKDLSEAV